MEKENYWRQVLTMETMESPHKPGEGAALAVMAVI